MDFEDVDDVDDLVRNKVILLVPPKVADVPGASLLQLRSSGAVHVGLASDGQAGSGRKHSHCAKVHRRRLLGES